MTAALGASVLVAIDRRQAGVQSGVAGAPVGHVGAHDRDERRAVGVFDEVGAFVEEDLFDALTGPLG